MSGVMSALVGMLIICTLFGLVAFMSLAVALYMVYKDIDIDDVTMEDEQ